MTNSNSQMSMNYEMQIPAAFSLCGSFAMILSYAMFKRIRSMHYFKIILYVACNDFLASIGMAFGVVQSGSSACWFQGKFLYLFIYILIDHPIFLFAHRSCHELQLSCVYLLDNSIDIWTDENNTDGAGNQGLYMDSCHLLGIAIISNVVAIDNQYLFQSRRFRMVFHWQSIRFTIMGNDLLGHLFLLSLGMDCHCIGDIFVYLHVDSCISSTTLS